MAELTMPDTNSGAEQASRAEGSILRPGSPATSSFLANPEICREEAPADQVHDIDCSVYGDAWDPEAPMRVRNDNTWKFDPDNDGHV